MKVGAVRRIRRIPAGQRAWSAAGFSLIELLFVVAILLIVSVMAIPLISNVMDAYRLRAAVASVTGAIQSTRYQAISGGYPYQVIFDKAASTFQVQSDPAISGTFSNVGNPVPLSSSAYPVVLGNNTTLRFRPSGIVTATAGSTTLTLTHGAKTETIQVSSYGNIKVTP